MKSAQAKKLKRYRIGLRARTFNGDKLKVNDKRGNVDEVSEALCVELSERLEQAGVTVEQARREIVEFDEERKAAMVSDLMVVLCGGSQVTPVARER